MADEPRIYIDVDSSDHRKVSLSTINKPGGRIVKRASLSRTAAIGAAARMLECAMRIPGVTVIEPCDEHWTGDIPEGCPNCVRRPG